MNSHMSSRRTVQKELKRPVTAVIEQPCFVSYLLRRIPRLRWPWRAHDEVPFSERNARCCVSISRAEVPEPGARRLSGRDVRVDVQPLRRGSSFPQHFERS